MANVFQWVQAHWGLIVGSLVVIANEVIAWNPKLKANSFVQFVLGLKAPPNQVQ